MSIQAATRGAIFGVIFVEVVRFIGTHFFTFLKFFGMGLIFLVVMYPMANSDANKSEIVDMIQYVSSDDYVIDGSNVTMRFDNQSRFKITKGILRCNGQMIGTGITVEPHSVANITYAAHNPSQPCGLTYDPEEVVRYRDGRFIYSYDQNDEAFK
jgi:hypothetical protein